MGWYAHLNDDRGHEEGTWNYTHNTSCMIYAVLGDVDYTLPPDSRREGPIPWWKQLDGMAGPHGAQYLDLIVRGLRADPERYRAMNPENGWGDYESFVNVLTEMRDAVPEWPTKWRTSG